MKKIVIRLPKRKRRNPLAVVARGRKAGPMAERRRRVAETKPRLKDLIVEE